MGSNTKAKPRQSMSRPRHAEAYAKATTCQRKARLGTTSQGKARQAEDTTCQGKACQSHSKASQSNDMPRQCKARHAKVSEGRAKKRQVRKNTKCRMGSLAKFWGKVEWKRRGRDESKRRRAESQWIVAARPLCHLQYPVAYLSRLQRILPAAQ